MNGNCTNDILTGTTYGHSRIRAFSGTDQGVVFDQYAVPIEEFGGGALVGGDVTTIPGDLLTSDLATDLATDL